MASPLIVINIQRGGLSTGLPTNVEQSDFASGDLWEPWNCPRIVLAAQNVEDCFYRFGSHQDAVRTASLYLSFRTCPWLPH